MPRCVAACRAHKATGIPPWLHRSFSGTPLPGDLSVVAPTAVDSKPRSDQTLGDPQASLCTLCRVSEVTLYEVSLQLLFAYGHDAIPGAIDGAEYPTLSK